MPEPGEKLETLYEGWGRGDYSRSDVFDPEMRLAESLGAVYRDRHEARAALASG